MQRNTVASKYTNNRNNDYNDNRDAGIAGVHYKDKKRKKT